MKLNLDLKSLTIGMLLGAIIATGAALSIVPKRIESWQYRTVPTEVLEKQLREHIFQAIQEGWTLAHSPHATSASTSAQEL